MVTDDVATRMHHYQHTQISWVILGVAGVSAALAVAVFGRTLPNVLPLLLLVPLIVVLTFGTLTVTVTGDEIELRFGVGLIHKRIPLSSVRSYRRVRILWYAGWGIRVTWGAVLYRASGLDAVELQVDGKCVRIGTDEPDALMDALGRVVSTRTDTGAESNASKPQTPARRVNPVFIFLAIVAVPVIVLVSTMFYLSLQPLAVNVSGGRLLVNGGMYRADIPVSDIVDVSLVDTPPLTVRRTNGFAFGSKLRGHFLVRDLGDGQLFIDRDIPPYVEMRTKSGPLWINFSDPARTRELYTTLRQAIERR